jgi:hypothetical protein
MRWFRRNRKFSGQLALFALALQFYLSFGHIHPDDIYGPVNLPLSTGLIVTLPAVESVSALPAAPPTIGDDICAICASMYMLGTSCVPDTPQVAPPAEVSVPQRVERIAVLVVPATRAPFQSRAPPVT